MWGPQVLFYPGLLSLGDSLQGSELCQMCVVVTGWGGGESNSLLGLKKMKNLLRIIISHSEYLLMAYCTSFEKYLPP